MELRSCCILGLKPQLGKAAVPKAGSPRAELMLAGAGGFIGGALQYRLRGQTRRGQVGVGGWELNQHFESGR